jgi:hypothetical protein
MVIFHYSHLPLWSSSITVTFHYGLLPLWSSSIAVIFHFGHLPLQSSSFTVITALALNKFKPGFAQLSHACSQTLSQAFLLLDLGNGQLEPTLYSSCWQNQPVGLQVSHEHTFPLLIFWDITLFQPK